MEEKKMSTEERTLSDWQKEQYELQKRYAIRCQDGCLEVEKAKAKAEIAKQNTLEIFEKKLLANELAREYREARIEEISISDEGGIVLGVRNTLVNVGQRVIANLKRPTVGVFRPLDAGAPPCYLLSGFLNEEEIKVFLDSEKLGRGSYLVEKLARAGIRFYLPDKKVKEMGIKLIATLAGNCAEVTALPERDGWAKLEDGSFCFFGEGELNWRRIKELCR